MSVQEFSLYPFTPVVLNLSGSIARTNHRLTLQYNLTDAFSRVYIPTKKSLDRKHNLWKTTCFECFLSVQNSSQYWEFNFSPSGNWNVYRFDTYRTKMREETAFKSLPFAIETQLDRTILIIEISLDPIIQPVQLLDIGITAVIQLIDGSLSYWAIKHCGTEADFHLRDSFVLKL